MVFLTSPELLYVVLFNFSWRYNGVAEEKRKRRVVKKNTETVREKAAKQTAKGEQRPRRIRSSARKASGPFRTVGRNLAEAAGPFAFLLAPFKTKPARFVGRFLAKVLFINYVINSWHELRQVTWPGRRDTIKLTSAVFVFAIVFSVLIAVVDFGLDKVFKAILLE